MWSKGGRNYGSTFNPNVIETVIWTNTMSKICEDIVKVLLVLQRSPGPPVFRRKSHRDHFIIFFNNNVNTVLKMTLLSYITNISQLPYQSNIIEPY